METKIDRENNIVKVEVIGRLDTLASEGFNAKMSEFLNEENIDLTIDCAQLDYIASSGLRTLLSLYKSLQNHSSTMTLINVKAVVMQVFKMSGFSSFLRIE